MNFASHCASPVFGSEAFTWQTDRDKNQPFAIRSIAMDEVLFWSRGLPHSAIVELAILQGLARATSSTLSPRAPVQTPRVFIHCRTGKSYLVSWCH